MGVRLSASLCDSGVIGSKWIVAPDRPLWRAPSMIRPCESLASSETRGPITVSISSSPRVILPVSVNERAPAMMQK